MKKYSAGIVAVILAISLSAYSTIESASKKSIQMYHWYTPDGQTSLGFGEFPNNNCTQEGLGCAKGFINPPSDPVLDPAQKTVRND